MADPGWIKKTIVTSLVLAGPALACLGSTLFARRRSMRTLSPAFWLGVVIVATYLLWFLNVAFEQSVIFMIAWPLAGIVLAIVGCVFALFVRSDRWKLFTANVLLLILSLASIIAPN